MLEGCAIYSGIVMEKGCRMMLKFSFEILRQWNIQSQVGWGSGKPDLVEDVLADCRELNHVIFKGLLQPKPKQLEDLKYSYCWPSELTCKSSNVTELRKNPTWGCKPFSKLKQHHKASLPSSGSTEKHRTTSKTFAFHDLL